MVYISLLEQQSKYNDALEVLSGDLGSLLMIEVDKLRIQVGYKAFWSEIDLNLMFLHYILRSSQTFWNNAYRVYRYMLTQTLSL